MNNPSLCFAVIDAEPPRAVAAWGTVSERETWERHYLVGGDHSLCLSQARRVFLTAHGSHDGFRTQTIMLDAAFPLDWMALNVIERTLPRRLRGLEIDGTDAQSFVDALAVPDLVQASVHRVARTAVVGATTVETSTLTVPQWNATAVATTFESRNPHALARCGRQRGPRRPPAPGSARLAAGDRRGADPRPGAAPAVRHRELSRRSG